MKKFVVLLTQVPGGCSVASQHDTVEEAIEYLQIHCLEKWIKGECFILENIPLHIAVN